jgi:2-octaprenyl-6-methoxyphenol hydroxylase
MKKQKVCIIGGGLTGLITALSLSKLNLNVDLVMGSSKSSISSNKTTAISQENYHFLKKLKITNFSKLNFWPCTKMKLYTDNKSNKLDKIFEIRKEKKSKDKILYMMNNTQAILNLIKSIKKEGLINIKYKKKVSNIVSNGLLKSIKFNKVDPCKYNLIILCTGKDPSILRSKFQNEVFEHSYDELAITSVVKHERSKNDTARQIFLDNEIFAFLPISTTHTSLVWSFSKKILKNKNKNIFFNKKINEFIKIFFKKGKIVSRIESRNLSLIIRSKYFDDRVLLFGDSLHISHPLAGQGFNMILRDLANLQKLIEDKLGLGLDIGSTSVLKQFENENRPRNFAYSLGIDFVKKSFSINHKSFKFFRNILMTTINKNNNAKNFAYDVANKGLRF